MKRPVTAVLLTATVLIVSLLFLPEFREALVVAKALLGNLIHDSYRASDSKLSAQAQRALVERNPQLLAAVALRSDGHAAISRAQQAVSIDARLTWMYAIVCSGYDESLTPECGAMINTLASWDPDNSVPYLLEAKRIARTDDPKLQQTGTAPADPAWHAAMARAFAAKHYDSYTEKPAQLNRALYAQHQTGNITDFADALIAKSRLPDITEARTYVSAALSDDPQSVIAFSLRVQAGANTDLEQLLAHEWLLKAYERQNELKPGSFTALQIAAEKNRGSALRHSDGMLPMMDPLAISFHFIVYTLAIAAALAILLFGAAAFQYAHRRTVRAITETLLTLSVGALASAAVALLLVYRPYSHLAHSLALPNTASNNITAWVFASLYHPTLFETPFTWVWKAILVLCGCALLFSLARFASDHRPPRVPAPSAP